MAAPIMTLNRYACALVLTLLSGAAFAQGEKIQPFDCRQISGPVPSPLSNLPEFSLRTPGKVILVCPFTETMGGYRIRFQDDDGFGGNSAVKARIVQYAFVDSTTTRRINGATCAFTSNSAIGWFNNGQVGNVKCDIAGDGLGYQAFVVELWSRRAHPDVRLLGIETY